MAGCTQMFFALLTACILQQLCATQVSCRGRCGELFSRDEACSCDDACSVHNQCCKDYEDVCTPLSCQGRCGEQFSGSKICSCDVGCRSHNECCQDYEDVCSSLSCRGRCGEQFSGGKICSCDVGCRSHNECCKDYEDVCSSLSCRGRCGEQFSGGKICNCDFGCVARKDCCTDFKNACTPLSCRGRCGELFSGGKICSCDVACSDHTECCEDYEDVCYFTDSCKGRCQESFMIGRECDCNPGCIHHKSCCPNYSTHCYMKYSSPESWKSKWTRDFPYSGIKSALPHARRSSGVNVDGGSVVKFVPLTKDPAASPAADADLYLPLSPENPMEITAAQSSSPDLCKGLPISGVASPFNGFIIVFKGHFFWLLDPKTREAGPARSITAALGIPSPIDTAFTRCNCESETYIIKGGDYWSFRNGVMEPGYPRSVSKDFAGLSGNIVAALSVPATRNMPEAVFFFKKGGTVQKLTYPAGSGPTCTGTNGSLSGEIDINLMWKGFPTPVTSALSMPNTEMPDGFEHYIFSGPNVLSIEVSGDIPVLAIPAKPPAENDVKKWLNCPQ